MVPLPGAPMRSGKSGSVIVELATRRPSWPCRRISVTSSMACSGGAPTAARSVGDETSCDTWGDGSNADSLNVTTFSTGIPDFSKMAGKTRVPITFEMVSSAACAIAAVRAGMPFSFSVFMTWANMWPSFDVLRKADWNGSASFGADEAIGMVTTFSRSAMGNAARASEELNGPMIASTFSSLTRVRTPTTACSGLPPESNVSIRSILPVTPPPASISLDGHLRGGLVGLREADERTRLRGDAAEDRLLIHRRGRRQPEAERRGGREGDGSVEFSWIASFVRARTPVGRRRARVGGRRRRRPDRLPRPAPS